MKLSQMVIIAHFLNKYQSTFANYDNISMERLHVLVMELESVVKELKELEEAHVMKPVLMNLPESNFKLDEVTAMLSKRTFQEVQYRALQLRLFGDLENKTD